MDVFLSYATEDRDRARQVAQALEECGWSVWWDRKIVAGEAFDQTIERYLESARCVVVLWSTAAVVSEWVKNEAAAAAERHVLVPGLVEDVKIPLEFRRRQTANLIDWDGDTSHEGFQALREGVAARVGTAAVARAPREPASRARPHIRWRRWAIVAGALATVAVAGWTYRFWATTPADQTDSSAIDDSPRGAGEQRANGGTSAAGLNVSRAGVVPSSGGNSIDKPAPVAFNVMHKVTLEDNEEYYLRLREPASAITIVQDVRVPKRQRSNLQTQLSVLDEDGGVVQAGVIRFNEIDVGYRRIATFSKKQPSRIGFKLLNTGNTADIWLAVVPQDKQPFLPFFGEIVPQAWPAGKEATGTLEEIEDAYHLVHVPRGEHRVILDFANAKGDRRNLQGYLAVLGADGGHQEEIMRLNEIDVSHREVGSLSVKGDGPLIFRVQNFTGVVNYRLRIVSAR
jgi:hypothetical protein